MAAFIAAFFVCAPAHAECFDPKELSTLLHRSGFSLFTYTLTDQGFLLKIFVGEDNYVITVEDENQSCTIATGKNLRISKGFDI